MVPPYQDSPLPLRRPAKGGGDCMIVVNIFLFPAWHGLVEMTEGNGENGYGQYEKNGGNEKGEGGMASVHTQRMDDVEGPVCIARPALPPSTDDCIPIFCCKGAPSLLIRVPPPLLSWLRSCGKENPQATARTRSYFSFFLFSPSPPTHTHQASDASIPSSTTNLEAMFLKSTFDVFRVQLWSPTPRRQPISDHSLQDGLGSVICKATTEHHSPSHPIASRTDKTNTSDTIAQYEWGIRHPPFSGISDSARSKHWTRPLVQRSLSSAVQKHTREWG